MFDVAKLESISSELYKVMQIGVDIVFKGYHHAMYEIMDTTYQDPCIHY